MRKRFRFSPDIHFLFSTIIGKSLGDNLFYEKYRQNTSENFCRGQEPIEECDIRDKWVV